MQFSIVIPARNEESNIGRCLDSIFQVQWDRSRYEVVVVDNGSTDSTVEIARSKGATVYVKPEVTISRLRNFGASQSAGELLAFIDADCTVEPGWLAEASRYLGRQEIVCFGSPPRVPEKATWVQKAWFHVRKKKEPVGATDWLESMNMFVRREAFASCGGFDESLVTCEDYDLCLRLGKRGSIVSDSRITATHHGEAATVAKFFRKERWRGISNMAGIRQHGWTLREMPSVVAPVLQFALPFFFVLGCLTLPPLGLAYLFALTACWQLVLLAQSARIQWPQMRWDATVQLYCLLNVYLFARGMALFQRK